MRRGGDRVAALRNHPCAGNVAYDLFPRQVPANARLRSLPHLDLNGRTRVQIIPMHAKAPRRNLHDRVRAVPIEVLMQTALACVVIGAQRLRCPC